MAAAVRLADGSFLDSLDRAADNTKLPALCGPVTADGALEYTGTGTPTSSTKVSRDMRDQLYCDHSTNATSLACDDHSTITCPLPNPMIFHAPCSTSVGSLLQISVHVTSSHEFDPCSYHSSTHQTCDNQCSSTCQLNDSAMCDAAGLTTICLPWQNPANTVFRNESGACSIQNVSCIPPMREIALMRGAWTSTEAARPHCSPLVSHVLKMHPSNVIPALSNARRRHTCHRVNHAHCKLVLMHDNQPSVGLRSHAIEQVVEVLARVNYKPCLEQCLHMMCCDRRCLLADSPVQPWYKGQLTGLAQLV